MTEYDGQLRWRSLRGVLHFAAPLSRPTALRSGGRVLSGTGVKVTPEGPVNAPIGASTAGVGVIVDPDGPTRSPTSELLVELRVEHPGGNGVAPRTDVLPARVRVIDTARTSERCGASGVGAAALAGALSTVLPLAAGAFKPAPLDPALLGPFPPPPPVLKP